MLYQIPMMHYLHRMQIVLCHALALMFLFSRPVYSETQRYVVSLLSMGQEIRLDRVDNIDVIKDRYDIILFTKPVNGASINVLSVGYFSSYSEAGRVASSLEKYFKGAYVSKFMDSFKVYKTIKTGAAGDSPGNLEKNPVSPGLSTLSAERLGQIMVSSRDAIRSGDNTRAIQLLSAVLTVPENNYSMEALELLGLARERNNQYNHAVNIYNKYISLYPGSEGVNRVRQRLAALITASKRIDNTMKEKDKPAIDRPWNSFGTLSQSYRNNNGDESELYTYLRAGARKPGEDTDLELLFSGSRTSPVSGDVDTDFQISEMYADAQFVNSGLSTQLGRMRTKSGGVYGRLDGLMLGYDDLDSARYNFLYGIPVDRSREQLFDSENKKKVYGVNTEMLFLDKALNVIAYLVEQHNDELLDRQAIGTELRYFNADLAVFSLLDYDTSYDQLSIFLLTGNWKTDGDLTWFFNVDYRTSPLLTTSNAIIGQTETDVGTLAAAIGEDAVRQLAEDRTSTSRLLSIGASWPVSSTTIVRTDVTVSSISSTPESGGVPATPEFGPDYYYSLQFLGTNYFGINDTTLLQFQLADTETSSKISTLASVRFAATQKLKITPRAVLSYTDVDLADNRTELRASLRADYVYSRNLYFDIDLSVDHSSLEGTDPDSNLNRYYLIATYRWLF